MKDTKLKDRLLGAVFAVGIVFLLGATVTGGGAYVPSTSPLIFDADTETDCVSITNADVDKTLSTVSDSFLVCAYGNTAYISCADAAPSVTTTVGQFFTAVADGQCKEMTIQEDICAVIGSSTAGFICFNPMSR